MTPSMDANPRATVVRIGFALVVVAVSLRALFARLPGLDPQSLWFDDLFFATATRTQSVLDAFFVPTHASPGFIASLWVMRRLFDDPEWSLQLLPFLCGLAAIPVMALAVRILTRDDGLAVLAAGLTALNPLLAHYSVFVKPFSVEFLATASLLLAAAWLFDRRPIDPRRFACVSLLGGLGAFFSLTSAFTSFVVVNVGALLSLRSWSDNHRRTGKLVLSAAFYNLLVLAAYMVARERASTALQTVYERYFLPLGSMPRAWEFLIRRGGRLLETSLPSWVDTDIWNPETVSWTLPFIGLGLVWLLARRSTRAFGMCVVGLYAAFVTASALSLYPFGFDRTDIFAFPAAILLFVLSVQMLTEVLPKANVVRGVIGLSVAAFAMLQPVHPVYWDVDDDRLVERLNALVRPSDGVFLSPQSVYLTAYYGKWPVIAVPDARSAVRARIERERTVHLPRADPEPLIDRFLATARPRRIWYVEFRTASREDVLKTLAAHDYGVQEVERTSRGVLHVALDRR